MATDLVALLIRANLALAVAVLAVLVLREPMRRVFGARVVYGLWAAVPLAGVGALTPLSAEMASSLALPFAELAALVEDAGVAPVLAAAWLAGALGGAALLGFRQLRFLKLARMGVAGPAVVGLLQPRIVVPKGYWDGFEPEERRLVVAHERAHLARGDHHVIALIAVLQCLCWFNPVVHFGARRARLDQELACDATVLSGLKRGRRLYAQALLKSQLVAVAPPLGCRWHDGTAEGLEARIRLLARPAPGVAAEMSGAAAAACVAALLGFVAWMAQPPAPPHAPFTYDNLRSVAFDLTPTQGR